MLPYRIIYAIVLILLLVIACTNAKQKNKKNKSSIQFRALSKQEKKELHYKADVFFSTTLKNNFSGGFLVAKNGEIIFEAYNGYSNWITKEPLTATTPLHIASVSKTFTGIAILQLLEQKKLTLADSVQEFFPKFPYSGITVEQLLNHRSGLPNYLYFLDTAWKQKTLVKNEDVLQYLINHKPAAYAYPNRVFHYCNTNYVLLALIVEHVTQQSFPDYIQSAIFKPLKMNHSFVFNIADTLKYTPSFNFNNQPFYMDKFDAVYGDKNVYSTVQDMFLWDKALYDTNFIRATTLQKAFTPYSNEKPGKKNYGLGFRLYIDNKDTTVYHNGWWHGNNSVFARLIKDTATIITLGNKYNRAIYSSRRLATIFSNSSVDKDLEE
ncbi:MAG: beta-lactamase family protein [Chitinophagaceae bacterium]|jgi:CubicO group peptidase (beta-lactamase class C family)|nr:beta-lactamase family protein [Chitinophagaceae bacterium]